MTRSANRPRSRELAIDDALQLFQPRSATPLTREDGREIYENLTGFFRTLRAIDQRRTAARSGGQV